MLQVIAETWTEVSIDKIKGEIDARFSQLPPYPGLRHFREGLSPTQRWTGNEYKTMARVYLGLMMDLLPKSAIRLVKAYLDVHRLAHYTSHSEDTRIMLKHAVDDYIKLRNDPEGPLVSKQILPTDWYSPKQHMLQHYPDWIQSKGVLPFCSTDRTEPLHQLHKADYKRSNKGPQYAEFLLNEERFTGWIAYESKLSSKDILQLNADDADGDEGTLDESDSEED